MLARRPRASLPSTTLRSTHEHLRTSSDQRRRPVSAVGSLTQMIRQECADVDRTREIPAAVVDALRDAGVFRMLAPRALGGAETDPLSFLRVVEEVSYADGSAGWCTMIGGCYATFGGMLPPQGAREIFGDPCDHLGGELPARQRRGSRSRGRLPGQRPLGAGERIEPRRLVHRGRHGHARRRAGHGAQRPAADAGVLLPRG